MTAVVTGIDALQYFIPEFILGITGFAILAAGMFGSSRKVNASITFVSLAASFVYTLTMFNHPVYVLSSTFLLDNFGLYFMLLFLAAGMLITFPAIINISAKSEIFFSLLLFTTVGMIIAASSSNLIVLFVSFEAVSTGTYVMTAFHKTERTLEASTKYFFTGAVSTSIIVLGISYFYEATGTFYLSPSPAIISSGAMLVSLILLVIGFGFKLAIFPMHQWAIDTYDGSENSVSAFLSTGSKLVAFMIMLRVFVSGFYGDANDFYIIFTLLAIVTMTYGNFSALSETNLKRLLAYSSVAQAGYLILVFSAAGYAIGISDTNLMEYAVAAGMIYSLVYIFMKGGAFLAMNLSSTKKVDVSDLSGLNKKSPAAALSLSILLLSLAGIPFTGGFLGKFFLFLALIEVKLWWLAVIAILNSAVSVFYYLRVILVMYRGEPSENIKVSSLGVIPLVVCAAAVIILGVYFALFSTVLGFVGGLFR
ncbi:MAG: NADH-quinone oxidoreductase subunit NuoN [Candidatus Thermoplasmatota archaeon]|nr:NADH-quinone oxidoreductase subunit NuoN [Candidatus Thermoplasmatota archaeon]MCL5731748.1 NADH-quinone oxidoreductase subunit NuoN [Candidatus Thermoplasmatota archaeon]